MQVVTTIDFELDNAPVQAIWSGQRGHVPRPELRGISVFDSDCARHYLQTREAATFQPSALAYFQQLANGLNQALRPRLQAEIAGLATDITPFNVIPADTVAGQTIHPIGPATDLTRARTLAMLNADEQADLTRLPQEISEADPTARATNLDNAAIRVDELTNSLAMAANIVSDGAIGTAQSAHRSLVEAEAAEVAASVLLQSEDATQLLPGTGQGPWALLFNAAREYSTSTAYPGHAFPVTDEGGVCVLCQQELTPEAKDRLQRFDRYIRNRAAEAAQVARNAWQQIVRDVNQATVTLTVSPVMFESLGARIATLTSRKTAKEPLIN